MAKRKRRKGAGPPPVTGPKRPAAAAAAADAASKPAVTKRRPGEPIAPSFRGVLLRAGLVTAAFYLYLVTLAGEDPGPAVLVCALAFALMLPLGLLIDRLRYKRQMSRWEEKRAARPPGR